jgi:uncharacterized protein (DUF849 family)
MTAGKVVNADASELHIHVRDETGLESLHPRCVDATMQALKAQLPDTLIGISPGAWIENNDDRLLEYIARWSVFPDYVSVNLSEKNAPAPSVEPPRVLQRSQVALLLTRRPFHPFRLH